MASTCQIFLPQIQHFFHFLALIKHYYHLKKIKKKITQTIEKAQAYFLKITLQFWICKSCLLLQIKQLSFVKVLKL